MGIAIGNDHYEIRLVFFDPQVLPIVLFQLFFEPHSWGIDIGLLGVYFQLFIKTKPHED